MLGPFSHLVCKYAQIEPSNQQSRARSNLPPSAAGEETAAKRNIVGVALNNHSCRESRDFVCTPISNGSLTKSSTRLKQDVTNTRCLGIEGVVLSLTLSTRRQAKRIVGSTYSGSGWRRLRLSSTAGDWLPIVNGALRAPRFAAARRERRSAFGNRVTSHR